MACLRVGGPLRQLAGGRADHDLVGATVGELVVAFEEANPAAAGWVLDEQGRIRRHINVFVNGELAVQATVVAPSDRVDVVPAITGGQ